MISLIVAMDRNGLIGVGKKLPWHRPEDLKNFKKLTLGNTVVMGKKTYDSIKKAFLGRNNIIITSDKYYYGKHGKCWVLKCSLQKALDTISKTNDFNDIYIIGGASIYREFASYIERMYITIINNKFSVDGEAVYFPWPAFERSSWKCIEQKMLGPDFYYVFDKTRKG